MASVIATHLRKHHEWYWAPLLYWAAIGFLYRDMFFPGDGVSLGFGWDTIEEYWADLAYLSAHLGGDEPPLWNPYERAGYPYFAMPERGLYYPINWLLAGWGAVVGEVSWSLIQFKGLLHHFIAAAAMHLYLRSRGLPRACAVIGAMAWLGSAPLLIHKASSVVWPMVWIPILWLAIDALVARPTWRRACILGGAVALVGHAGSAPGLFYTLLMAAPYGAYRAAAALWSLRERPAELRRGLVAIGAAGTLAAALAAAMLLVQLVPTAELTALSQRAQRGLGYVLSLPLPAGDTLAGLWAPLTGKQDAYVGVLVMLLACCGLIVAPRRDRGAPVVFAALAGFFLILSFGGGTPVLGWLATHLPGFDLFRVANRYKLLFAPLIAVVAAYGAAGLLAAPRAWSRERIAGVAVALATLAVVVGLQQVVGVERVGHRPSPWFSPSWAAVGVAVVAAAVLLPARLAVAALALAAGLVLYDPQHFVHHQGQILEPRVDNLEDREWLEGLADVATEYRIYDEFVLEQRPGSRLGVREFRGYPAGAPLEPVRYGQVIQYLNKHPHILAAFNVRYVFHGRHHRIGTRVNHIARRPDQLEPTQYRQLQTPRCARLPRPAQCPVFEALHPAPAVAWYGAIDVVGNPPVAILDRLRVQLETGDGQLRVVALEPDAAAALEPALRDRLARAGPAPPDPVVGAITRLSPNRVVARVEAPASGIVVLNEAWYPGWEVAVDGRPAASFVANWLVRGVAVDAGTHTVTWQFRPAHYELYRALFTLGLLAFLLAALWPRRG